MFRALNSRFSIGFRLGLIASLAAAPIAVLVCLFVGQVWKDVRFAEREIWGAGQLAQLWPRLADPSATASPERAEALAGSMRTLADRSNLTLDTELDSFYAQDAATVELPRLAVSLAHAAGEIDPARRAAGLAQARVDAATAASALNAAMSDDRTGRARALLAPAVGALSAAGRALGDPASIAAAMRAADAAWRADQAALTEMLRARIARLERQLAIGLTIAGAALGLAAILMVATAQGLTERLQALLRVMDRLNAGDTSVDTPFLGDANEIGRIALMLEALRRGMVERAEAQRRVEAANAALREGEMRLRASNWALNAHARSTLALLHRDSPGAVAADVCKAIVEDDTYALACVALTSPDTGKALRVVAGAGRAAGYLEGLKLSWSEDVPEGLGPTGAAIRAGAPLAVRDMQDEPMFALWRERALAHGLRSSATVPFSQGETILGVLIVYASRPDAFADDELALFGRLGEELAFAIALEEDRRRLARSQEAQRLAEEAEQRSRRQLEESEARFRMLAEEVSDVILRYDRAGIVEYVSPSIAQFGYRPEQWIGRVIGEFGHPDDQPRRREVRGLLFAGQPLPAGLRNESRLRRADGTWVWVEGRPTMVRDRTGQPIAVITALRDVTERHAMEEELRRKRAEAEAATRAKSQFLANMSHEIRTPLTGVIGFAGLLQRAQGLNHQAQGFVRRIVSGGQALLSLVDDILDFSRIEGGHVRLAPRPTELRAFFEEAVDLVRPQADAKGLNLSVELREGAPPWVTVDPDRLRQVLLNLTGNAIKFTPGGEVAISASYWPANGGYLRVAVRDTGPGVPPDLSDRLFQRFTQVDESDTRRHGGAGLGLAISKGLVELMGGEIGVDGAPGGGSIFWFTVAAPCVEAGLDSGRAEPGEPHLAPLRILVVDDVEVNRELVSTMLSPFDLDVEQASDGAEAVEAADRARFDLILMDLQMPRMDGYAATRAIRGSAGPNRATPILALSANVLPEQVDACRAAGMNDHIGKPIDLHDLVTKVDRWTAGEAGA